MSRLHRVLAEYCIILLETHAPSSNAQWLSAVEHVQARSQKVRIKAPDYHVWWLVRTHLIVEMRHAGIDRLKLQQDLGTTRDCECPGARHEQVGVDVDKESWELIEDIIEAVAVHRAIGIIDLLCVLVRRLCK